MTVRRDERVLTEGRWLRLIDRGGWEFAQRIRCNGVVAVIALTDDARLVLVEQFRPSVGVNVVDLPAGLVGDGDASESVEQAAARELEEETGYRAEHFQVLFQVPGSSGLSDERVTLLRAGKLSRVSPGGGTGDEDIRVHVIAPDALPAWLDRARAEGKLVSFKVYAALYLIQVPA